MKPPLITNLFSKIHLKHQGRMNISHTLLHLPYYLSLFVLTSRKLGEKPLFSVHRLLQNFSPTIIIESFRFLFPISLPALKPSSSSGSGQFGYHRYYSNWIGSGRICTLSMGVEDEFPWKWKTQSRGGRHLSSSPQTYWILFSFPRVRPQLFDLRCTQLLCLLSVTWFYGKQ